MITNPTNEHREQARQIIGNVNNYAEDDGELSIPAFGPLSQRIASALSSRDTKIREVLEGLRGRFGSQACWCDADNDSPHFAACILAHNLYAKLLPGSRSACTWTYDPDGYWQTSCDDQFCITEGSPAENRMRYCHYCGRRITTSAEVGVIDAAQPAP